MKNKLYTAFLIAALGTTTAAAQTSNMVTKLTGVEPKEVRLPGESILQAEVRLEEEYRKSLLERQSTLQPSLTSFSETGQKDGVFLYKWPNGEVARFEDYKNGQKHGTWKFYDENGQDTGQVFFENGVMVGASGIFRSYFHEGHTSTRSELTTLEF